MLGGRHSFRQNPRTKPVDANSGRRHGIYLFIYSEEHFHCHVVGATRICFVGTDTGKAHGAPIRLAQRILPVLPWSLLWEIDNAYSIRRLEQDDRSTSRAQEENHRERR